jgi:osmotically inducible protein OsmC
MPVDEIATHLYTISATARQGREGHVRSEDGVIDLDLARPGQYTGEAKANPETLLASGWAACFSSALNLVSRRARVDASGSTVTVSVSLGRSGAVPVLAADIVADIPDSIDRDTAQGLLDEAHELCPFSRATRGNIRADARLAD